MPSSISQLALGSVNFGLTYGIANGSGQLTKKEIIEILNLARASGITMIDTAHAYGESELRLGQLHNKKFEIVTKIGSDLEKSYRGNKIKSLVHESLDRLAVDKVNALLLHRPELLLGPDGPLIAAELNNLKEMGLAEKIGVSIYSPNILDDVTKLLGLDIVQAPFNLFDQRILKSGWSEKLKEKGTEIHTRSTFLQGLLVMGRSELPEYFSQNWATLFEDWFTFQNKLGVHADEIALDFALQQKWIDKIVIGVDSAMQLRRLLQIEARERFSFTTCFDVDDIDLIDPSRWRI